jgi:hypothetical protein
MATLYISTKHRDASANTRAINGGGGVATVGDDAVDGGGVAAACWRLVVVAGNGGHMAATRGVGVHGDTKRGAAANINACVGASWRSDAAVFTVIGAFTCTNVMRATSVITCGRRALHAVVGLREAACARPRTVGVGAAVALGGHRATIGVVVAAIAVVVARDVATAGEGEAAVGWRLAAAGVSGGHMAATRGVHVDGAVTWRVVDVVRACDGAS